MKNSELLKLMILEFFDALLTFDKNLQYQQNFAKYPITVFVLSAFNNIYEELKTLTPQVNNILLAGKLNP